MIKKVLKIGMSLVGIGAVSIPIGLMTSCAINLNREVGFEKMNYIYNDLPVETILINAERNQYESVVDVKINKTTYTSPEVKVYFDPILETNNPNNVLPEDLTIEDYKERVREYQIVEASDINNEATYNLATGSWSIQADSTGIYVLIPSFSVPTELRTATYGKYFGLKIYPYSNSSTSYWISELGISYTIEE